MRYQHVYAAAGTSAMLECELEAFPEPVKFWKRRIDNRILEPSDKFRMETSLDGYKSRMQLNITRIGADDYGEYHCVGKNEVNTTAAILYLDDRKTPPNRGYADVPVVFGPEAPPNESYEDICGPPTVCADCAEAREAKCRDSLPLYDLVGHLEIKPTDPLFQYPGLPNRTFGRRILFEYLDENGMKQSHNTSSAQHTDCVLYAVGKPVFNRQIEDVYGAWLRDPQPRNEAAAEKYYTTSSDDNLSLMEYADKERWRNHTARVHRLPKPGFVGNAHVVYNGSFYYQEAYTNRVIRYDLESSAAAGE